MNIIQALENLSDDGVEMAIIGQAIDTFPSKFGFPERQVSATNVPAFRKVAVELVKMVEKDYRSRLVAMPHVKDHTIAAVVNDLRDTAVRFHNTQQLRARMRHCIEPLLISAPVQPVAVPDESHNAAQGDTEKYEVGKFYWVQIVLDPDAANEWENQTMPARFAGYSETGEEMWNFLDPDTTAHPVRWSKLIEP